MAQTSDTEGSSDRNVEALTFFNRLAEEAVEENLANSSGVLSTIFTHFWRTQSTAESESSGSATFYFGEVSHECEHELITDADFANPLSGQDNGINSVSSKFSSIERDGNARTSPSTSSFNSQEVERPSRKFPDKLTNMFKGGSKQGLMDYNTSSFRQYWMPDSTGKECYQCEERFSTFRRRHHCRLCGQIFCAKCCNIHVPGSTLGYIGDLRLCHYCAKMMAQYLPPEEKSLQTEEMEDSIVSNDEQISHMNDGSPVGVRTVSTVSTGPMMWRCPSDIGSSNRSCNETSFAPRSHPSKPPTLLCANELYLQHEKKVDPQSVNVATNLRDEEDSGPDWFRNMESDANFPIKDSDHKLNMRETQHLEAQFDPLPISIEGSYPEVNDNIKPLSTSSLIPTSSLRNHYDDDIDSAFDVRAEHLLSYICSRERLSDPRWKSVILNLAKEIAYTVKIDVAKRRDQMNILNYVHVKKLYIEQEEPSAELIWGVVCSKSVQHECMAGPLKDASVMIVAGSIEYERVPGRLSTLEPILCQEGEFLAKQVERILSRRPSVLLVEGNVSRIASNLLCDARVRLVVNVSAKVLHRVARSTGADILPSSDAQLIQQNIGFCPSFTQRSISFKDGRRKLFLKIFLLEFWVMDECPPDRGCSVLLKGGDARELKAVKRILLFLISCLYSSRLEKMFLNMFNVRLAYSVSECEICETRRESNNHNCEKSDFEIALSDSILCASPFIYHEPPYLKSPRGKNCSLLPYFNVPVYQFFDEDDFDARLNEEESEVYLQLRQLCRPIVPHLPRHVYAISGACNLDIENTCFAFRALSGAIFKKRLRSRDQQATPSSINKNRQQTKRHDILDPYVHQRIAVLFGSFSPKSPNAPYFCVRPWVVNMEFYGPHDMTLGEFLTKYCFNKSYECPSSNCEVPMLDHSRKLVYGRVCIEVTTQIVVSGSEEPMIGNVSGIAQICAWNYCNSCKLSSPVIPMSMSVWHLSFGKYLDYIAYSAYTKIGDTLSPVKQQCSHCFFHEHTHFYSLGNYVASFKITPVRPYNVQFSPVQCRIIPNQYSKQALLDGITRMASLADDIIRTAKDRLGLFTKHDHYSEYAGTFHTVLRQVVDVCISATRENCEYVEELKAVNRNIISSNDIYAVKANEALMHIREAIYNLITTWNDQSTVLAATVRAVKRTAEDTSAAFEAADIALEKIDDPFPKYLHLGLKLQPRVGVVVRDIVDSRGNYKPDIGSIIAYALSAADYEEKRRKQGEAAKGEQPPFSLNSGSAAIDEEALAAEHIEVEFQDSQTSYYVKAYYAARFRLLRKLLFTEGEEAFIRSLSQSTIWTPQGGKSGSFFYRTQDDRFVVKQMSRFEIQSFIEFAPHYFEYVKTAVVENKLTTLCKVYGVFRVGYKSKATQLKVDILVMEYLFYKHNVNQVWDLKGSLRNRMAAAAKTSSELVLLDENLMKDLWNKQLYIYPHAKAALNQAISNDSHFLSSQHVMDYSLLVGVDERNGELILGIVDYMRTYTLDKKLESWVKIVAIPGAHLPTILSPEMYCTRFSEAMDTYFPVIPDQWTGFGSSVSY